MTLRTSVGPEDRVTAAEHVHCRQFDDDLVMVDLNGGEYFALDAIGARMWALLISGKTPAEIGATLAGEYNAGQRELLDDCTALANDLLKRGLIVVRPP
jgi:hypothetical protein